MWTLPGATHKRDQTHRSGCLLAGRPQPKRNVGDGSLNRGSVSTSSRCCPDFWEVTQWQSWASSELHLLNYVYLSNLLRLKSSFRPFTGVICYDMLLNLWILLIEDQTCFNQIFTKHRHKHRQFLLKFHVFFIFLLLIWKNSLSPHFVICFLLIWIIFILLLKMPEMSF